MTTITGVRPYLRLDELDRIIVADRVQNFIRYAKTMRQRTPQPPPTIIEPVRCEEPTAPDLYAPNPETGYGMLPVEVAAWLRKHKRGFILNHIAKGIGRNEASVRHALERMMGRGEVVKYKEGKSAYYTLAQNQPVEAMK